MEMLPFGQIGDGLAYLTDLVGVLVQTEAGMLVVIPLFISMFFEMIRVCVGLLPQP